jgi:hypothetical protein
VSVDSGVNETAVLLNKFCIAEFAVSMALLYQNSDVTDTAVQPTLSKNFTNQSIFKNALTYVIGAQGKLPDKKKIQRSKIS